MKVTDLLKSKVVWGGLLVIGADFLRKPAPTAEDYLAALGGALLVIGGRHAIGKLEAASRRAPVLLAWLLAGACFLGLPAAQAAPPVTPFVALTAERLSGPDEWSTGFEVGAETTHDPLYVYASVSLQDVLADRSVYPWDSTFRLGAGVYSHYDIFGIPATPYGGFRLARPSRPTEWSFGVELGSEIAFEPVWLRLGVEFNDWLSDRQVYPWDTTVRLGVGIYFAEPEPGERGGARGTRHRS